MAKAIKYAALAIGAAALIATGVGAVALPGLAGTLTVAGISTSTLFLVSGGLSIAATLLQKAPKVTASQTDRLTANVDPRAFRKTWLGQTAGPVDVRYEEWSGPDQEICDWIIALASHAIDGVEEIWFDTEMAWSATTGVVGKYIGYFSIPNLILEGTPQNAFTFASGIWNSNTARLTGCAYARFRFKVTGNSKKAESPFASGIPSRITIIGRGAKLYDPRRDSTVSGGSGPMRWDDQSTWRYTADDGVVIGENLPLQILRVVLGWRIRNPTTGVLKLATGSGVPGRRISFPSFQIAASLADELVNRAAGGNEPRYHGAGVISEGDDQKTVLDMLCAACCSRFRDTGGKLALVVSHNDLAVAATDDGLNDDDVVGGFSWDPDPSLDATPNVVRGKYVDATTASLYQLIDYPEVSLPSPDRQDRYLSLDLGVVESPSHAQRVAKQVLQRRQYARQFTAPFDIRAWKYTVGDVLPFTFAPLGFTRGLFRVKEQELGQGGTCNMVLTFETPAFYLWDASDVLPVQAADAIVYDSRNNPLILAIDEAAGTALWSGVTGDGKPQDNATVGAPVGTTVAGRSAQDVVDDLDVNAMGIITQALRQDDLAAITDARTFVLGQPVSAYVLEFRKEQTTENTAINSRFELLGAKTVDGTGWVLNTASVQIGGGKTLADELEEIGVTNGALTVSVQQLMEAVINPDGSGYAKFVLRGDVNGSIVGIAGTTDGTISRLSFVASEVEWVDPNAGDPVQILNYVDGRWLFNAVVAVQTLVEGAVVTESLAPSAAQQTLYYVMPADVACPQNQNTTVVARAFSKHRSDSVLKITFWGRAWSPDDLTFTAAIVLTYPDGAIASYPAGEYNMLFDKSGSLAKTTLTPFTSIPDLPIGNYTAALSIYNGEDENLSLAIKLGSLIEVIEIKKGAL